MAACGMTPDQATVMAGGEVMPAVLQSAYPSPARTGVQEEVMPVAPSSRVVGEVVMPAVLRSAYPTSPPSHPEVMPAVLRSAYPLGPHAGQGHAFESRVSECFCELAPRRLLSRGSEEVMPAAPSSRVVGEVVMPAVLQSAYPASPSSHPEVMPAVLQSAYPLGPNAGRGHAYSPV